MFMNWLRKAPTSVVIAIVAVCGVITLGLLAVYTLLTLNGVDTTSFRQWLITVGVTIILPLLGVNTIGTISAARSSSNAEDQTNGQLAAKDARIKFLEAQLRASETVHARPATLADSDQLLRKAFPEDNS